MVGPSVNIWMAIGAIFFGIVAGSDFGKGNLGTVPRYSTARDKVTMWAAVAGMLVASVMYILLDYEMLRDIVRDTFKWVCAFLSKCVLLYKGEVLFSHMYLCGSMGVRHLSVCMCMCV